MPTNIPGHPLILVVLGGGIGAGLRYLFGEMTFKAFGPGFPWGTWGVNILGGLLMGLLAAWLIRVEAGQALRLFLGVGVLGGFTTFSAFSLELFNMIARGQVALGAAYAISSVAGAVTALFAGFMLVKVFA